MSRAAQSITYSATIWLLLTQVWVTLPFMFYLPLWLLPVLLLTAGWRLRMIKGKGEQPGIIVKGLLIVSGVAALLGSGMTFPSLDVMVALLLLGFAFKALEVEKRRDAIIVLFLGYFLTAVLFLYSQSILTGLYSVVSLVLLTAALIGVQYPLTELSTTQSVRHHLNLGGLLLLQCLPLMLVIFVFAPRLPPLFSLPLVTGQAKTGIAESMAPGEIAKLSQSSALAFRVSFEGERPTQSQLYWRGFTLNYFDGRRWSQFADDYGLRQLRQVLRSSYRWQPDNIQVAGEPIAYEVVYERTGQPWLFTLTPTTQVSGAVMQGADYRVMARREVDSPFLLRAVSYPESQRDVELDRYVRSLALQLPANGNQRSRELARQLWQQADGKPARYIQQVLQRYQQQDFYYTLRPPVLGTTNTIDKFLFESQRGFCSHYAGSFVFLMRAAGIPARVVAGYQGGEWNTAGEYLQVHQYDAHAWTEVWLEHSGWVRIDPTTMVAPERTEQGLEAALSGEFLAQDIFSGVRKISWLTPLRQKLDAIQYGWRRWVLGYDGQAQSELLKKLLGQITWQKMLLALLTLFGAIGLFWLLLLGLNRTHGHEQAEQRLYRQFCRKLAKRGVERDKAQAPGDFAAFAATRLPDLAEPIRAVSQAYEVLCYLPDEGRRPALLAQMKQGLRDL